ncbi:hypothetical protein IEQ34_011005 [Dendrobium chrysotoxum]|uniref:Uncharacterized protein n=1 Tax=Dendrobium chrysotoxum TaxID=161865 RepID=A0AAV7GWH7_DENCH|nr:hypothetical protein IEQ34_011005 [Dendrobium chrysotoxum]
MNMYYNKMGSAPVSCYFNNTGLIYPSKNQVLAPVFPSRKFHETKIGYGKFRCLRTKPEFGQSKYMPKKQTSQLMSVSVAGGLISIFITPTRIAIERDANTPRLNVQS